MQAPDIKKKPVAILTPDAELAQRLSGFFTSTKKVPKKNILHVKDTKKAVSDAFARASRDAFSLIILDETLKNKKPADVYETLRAQHPGPVVCLVTPGGKTEKALRKVGRPFCVSREGLTDELLSGLYDAAWHHQQLENDLCKAKHNLQEARQRFQDVADSFSDWIWEIDTNMKVQHVSKGRRETSVLLQEGAVFTNCFLPEDRQKVQEDFKKLFDRQKPFYDYEYWGLDLEGMRVCWSISGVPVTSDDGDFLGYRGVSKDISTEKSSQDQLYYLANNDTLTGVYNRGRFYDELNRAIREMRKQKDSGAIMLLDIDRFKYVNDTFGHDAGDSMLVHTSHIIRDVVGDAATMARLGGDEFALIFTNTTEDEVTQTADDILKRMTKSPFHHADHEVALSASVGVVLFPTQGSAAGELLSKADIAMYRAKADGRNRYYVFDEQHLKDHGMAKRLEVVDFITRALDDDRVHLYYQPIVPLQTKDKTLKPKNVKHYEVLCRMLDENGEIVMPFYFIETAEDFGLIQQIDMHMCRNAVAFLKARHKIGQDLTLAINLSGITFDDEETMAKIRGMVQEANLPRGSVIFEITETTALRDIGRAQRAISSLKKVGCKFALDDFGVGYSSFSYVRHLDIDYVKIDGSFIRQINDNLEDRVFVKALNDVAKGMGIETIAEMVEDEDAEEHIRQIGIDYGQGYHFGRPGPYLLDEDD